MDDYDSGNKSANSAPQQQVNGAYRMVDMLTVLAMELDTTGRFTSMISDIRDTFKAQNNSANGAPQQLVNGLYRSVELAAIVAMLLE